MKHREIRPEADLPELAFQVKFYTPRRRSLIISASPRENNLRPRVDLLFREVEEMSLLNFMKGISVYSEEMPEREAVKYILRSRKREEHVIAQSLDVDVSRTAEFFRDKWGVMNFLSEAPPDGGWSVYPELKNRPPED
ncbi:hypothetical protein SAMN02745673_04758 [Marinactinospora thermotolerans DSM 45154]|uniref:Uncharacterized protein n=1 Tax=Marinactinospora thermotolerans DSM 45154 TaxID=1122192 RepID=A0A1T4TBX1_9ACTN|nr:hypothetical protein [Marinactinospora thermotolerans]SKA37923.1 hypothetical protein SAMN02745673_04758 [Marinactinospora thermotolerans DSM 45154]